MKDFLEIVGLAVIIFLILHFLNILGSKNDED